MIEAVSCHHHTTMSFLDGEGTPKVHAERAAKLGYTALAFTEHGNVSSLFPAEKACLAAGIKFIPGIEAYTASSYAEPKQTKYHLTILAENLRGYRNLNQLVTLSYGDNFYYHPTMTGQAIADHRDGLIILSGCSGSYMACNLIGGKGFPEQDGSKADRLKRMSVIEGIAERFRTLHGDNFYLEVQAFPELPGTCTINKAYGELSRVTGIPLAATMDVHYPTPEDSDLQVILHACGPQGRGKASADEMLRRWNYEVKLTLPTSDREWEQKLMGTGLSRVQARQAIANTALIGEQCNVTLPKAERLKFPCPEGWTAEDLIWEWLREGWRFRRLGNRTRKEQEWYHQKLQYEMKLILDKDFIDFFLATADVIKWCKEDGNGTPIPVGPGRGSAAASLVCWLLRITEIDPHRYPGLVFERFIDVTRTDPPDIDLDFDSERRPEVRAYLASKYGPECVGTIANYVQYRPKNAIDDVARVHRIPKAATKIVKDLIVERSGGDSRYNNSLEDTVAMFPNAQAIFDAFPALWLAARLEGNVRGMSIHAAGMVVANTPLTDICATYEREGRRVLSVDKYGAEYAGMLKMDFLGLTTMTMIARCLELTGLTLEDLYAVPDTDQDTLDVFRRNDVIGIFQFEGRATRVVCGDVVPDNFAQVADINALSRPGPLFSGTTAAYCGVKHGRQKPDRYHSVVDNITKDTFYQIIYQEQILKILQVIGGFDWTDLNEIRRIIAKKIGQAAFQVSMDNFQKGALELHGIDNETSERIWKHLVTSGTYAFNVAHAVSYSIVSWWQAYLKAHYLPEFYAASLARAKPGGIPAYKLMKDAERHGIPVRAPNIYSGITWQPFTDKRGTYLTSGLTSIPGVGDKTAAAIISARETEPFTDWPDLTRAHGVGDKTVETMKQFSLSQDPFGLDRIRRILDRVIKAIKDKELDAPLPTHDGEQVAAEVAPPWGSKQRGKLIIFIGIPKARVYQDIVENIHSRTGDDLDEIEANLKDPHLRKYCFLQCIDDKLEEVYVRINRYKFPQFKRRLESIDVGKDVIIASGRKTPGFGNSIKVEGLWVIDPD